MACTGKSSDPRTCLSIELKGPENILFFLETAWSMMYWVQCFDMSPLGVDLKATNHSHLQLAWPLIVLRDEKVLNFNQNFYNIDLREKVLSYFLLAEGAE